MTSASWRSHALPATFGVAMIAAALPHPRPYQLGIAALALTCIGLGTRYTAAVASAVALTATAIVLGHSSPVDATISGLAAAGYLATRLVSSGSIRACMGTLLSAVSFGVVGLVVSLTAFDVVWLPLLAPLGMLAAFTLTVGPYLPSLNDC